MEKNTITEKLRINGLKVTPQRLAVYNVLCDTNEHPNAETIYDKLHVQYPTMSLATVYKTLEVMVKIGLVKQLNVGEDSFRYDARVSSHPHVRCMSCGAVQDVWDIEDEELMNIVERKTAYKLMDRQLYFFGVCPRCQRMRH